MMRIQAARPKKSVLIATTQRCGGTWLASLMESTGSLGRPEEWLLPSTVLGWGSRHRIPIVKIGSIPACVLHRAGIRGDRDQAYTTYRNAVNPRMMQRYLERLAAVEATPNAVFSAHLQWDHLEVLDQQWKGSVLELADQNFWLFLWREDQLEQAISWMRARSTGQWASSHQSVSDALYDGEELRRRFLMVVERNQRWMSFFNHNAITPFELTYEQVQADQNRSVDEILTWVGEARTNSVLGKHRDLKVQRGTETQEWIARFTEENPDLISQRFRPRGGATQA